MNKIFVAIIISLITLSGCGYQPVFLPLEEKTIVKSAKIFQQPAVEYNEEMYNNFIKSSKPFETNENIKGGIVPHHLVGGKIIAGFFDTIKHQNPSLIVLIGPNHFSRGQGNIISTNLDWQTPYGVVSNDAGILNKLIKNKIISVDNSVLSQEHSIYASLPFISYYLPGTKVVSFILKNNISNEQLDKFIENLGELLPRDAVIVSSIDFSHYQNYSFANFHDELSQSVIKTFDYSRLSELEIDSVPSIYTLLKFMEKQGTQTVVYELSGNSAISMNNFNLPETTSYYSPYFVKGKLNKEKVVSILNFGDIMLDRSVKQRIDENNSDYILEKLAGKENRFFQGMDIISANLEGPFANYRRATTKSIAFRFDPVLIPMLKKYNFSLFNLANNHALDMSREAFEESKTNLKNAGIDFYGIGYGISDDSYLQKEVGGVKISFVGVDDTLTPVNEEKLLNLIQKGEAESDFVVVNIHWGAEYQILKSNSRQQDLAHKMIDAGVDLIIGHHPHVIQEMEIYKNRPIFYSLGNFIFDQYFSTETQQGLSVGSILSINEQGQKGISLYVYPLESNNSQQGLVSGGVARLFMDNFFDKSLLAGYKFANFKLKINL